MKGGMMVGERAFTKGSPENTCEADAPSKLKTIELATILPASFRIPECFPGPTPLAVFQFFFLVLLLRQFAAKLQLKMKRVRSQRRKPPSRTLPPNSPRRKNN